MSDKQYITTEQIGWTECHKFEVVSGVLCVTDPCYTRGTWCAGSLRNVKNGTWYARAFITNEGDWGNRVAKLLIEHADHMRGEPLPNVEEPFNVGVDSGQAGFFDDSIYPHGECGEFGDKSTFYGQVCDLTCGGDYRSDHRAGGIIGGRGVVTSSGYGDGGYGCYTRSEDGQVVAAMIVFIDDEEESHE